MLLMQYVHMRVVLLKTEFLMALRLNVRGMDLRFDVRTGEVRNPPADTPQLAYEVKIDGDWILIKEKLQPEEQQ